MQVHYQLAHKGGQIANPAHCLGIAHTGRANHADRAADLTGCTVLAEDYAEGSKTLLRVLATNVDGYFPSLGGLRQDAAQQNPLFQHSHHLLGAVPLGELRLTQQQAQAIRIVLQ